MKTNLEGDNIPRKISFGLKGLVALTALTVLFSCANTKISYDPVKIDKDGIRIEGVDYRKPVEPQIRKMKKELGFGDKVDKNKDDPFYHILK